MADICNANPTSSVNWKLNILEAINLAVDVHHQVQFSIVGGKLVGILSSNP